MNLGKIILKSRPPKIKASFSLSSAFPTSTSSGVSLQHRAATEAKKSIGKLSEWLAREIAAYRCMEPDTQNLRGFLLQGMGEKLMQKERERKENKTKVVI